MHGDLRAAQGVFLDRVAEESLGGWANVAEAQFALLPRGGATLRRVRARTSIPSSDFSSFKAQLSAGCTTLSLRAAREKLNTSAMA